MLATTSGNANTAVGYGTLQANTTGSVNTAIGETALTLNTTGNLNTAVGGAALGSNTTGGYNIAVGGIALATCSTGAANTAVGYGSLFNLTTGQSNTAIGINAGQGITTGNLNTALGRDALSAVTTETNSTGVGYAAAVTGSNQVQLGNSATTTYAYGAVQNRSDLRDKTSVRATGLGLDFVLRLKPVDFQWAYREDQGKVRSRFHHGFIAQDVKKVMDAMGTDFGGYQDHKVSGGGDVLSLGYQEFIAPMVKAIQELQAQIDELKALARVP
jgi:hypothetical protein